MKPLLPPVVVNGATIAPERIAAEAQNHPAPRAKPGLAWKAAARALVIRELMLQEAHRRGIEPVPTELAPGQVETDDEALIRQLLEAVLRIEPASEAELRAVHAANPDRFRAPTLYEAAHILFTSAPGGEAGPDHDALRAKAEAVLAELKADPRRFAGLAREHSACPSRDSGGFLGQIVSGDTVPEFEAALENLEEGQITPAPVPTRFGLHLIRLDARARGDVLPFENVLPGLREAHAKAQWTRAARAFTEELVAAAEIEGITFEMAA
ncbi:peptidylprolyl isomerase [Alkalilacustris brevis]|uniref:peptidylprolyl isomerase n=1 Tax=Alkalilacustris brevis TaxID=2026338 RepID=UPI000E0D8E5C|nr:peptidylprolyl isomerase [Alkalilacustris brevis]